MYTNNMAGQLIDSKVNELPASTIRLIGSGQVITSVYSVVKELFENSVDASATNVDIKLDDFGLERIEVCDNGKGVKKLDVPLMTKRHYTSKLSGIEDLLSLGTYGFRGEALASLCAVSDVTIVTKTKDDDVSTVYSFDEEGKIKSSKPSHLGTGTTVTARHLFQKLPVRKQYYKTSQRKKEDLHKIEDLLIVFSIIKPNLRIRLRHGGDIVFQKLPVPDTKGVLHAVLGRQITNQLLCQEKSLSELQGSLLTFLPKPGAEVKTMSRATSDRTFMVVNDRPVQVKEMLKLLKRYYMNCHACDSTRFPVCYISVKLPLPDVDVNLDPNKTTVLLRPLKEVCTALEEILLQVYGPLDNVPSWHYSSAPEKKDNDTVNNNENNNLPISKPAVKESTQVDRKMEDKRIAEDCHTNASDHNPFVNEKSKDLNALPHQKSTDSDINSQLNENNIEDLFVLDALSDSFVPSFNTDDDTSMKSTSTEVKEDKYCKRSEVSTKSPETTSNSINSNTSHEMSTDTCGNEWSRGCMLLDTSGQTIQPVQLLAPTSKHTPGKRPLSPTSKDLDNPPLKCRSPTVTLWDPPQNQQTLPGLMNTPSMQTSLSGSSNKRQISESVVNKSPRIQETKALGKNETKKISLRDQVAAQASQSQAEKTKKSLRQRLYHAEKELLYAKDQLSKAVVEKEQNYNRASPQSPAIVGQANLCEAWFCTLGDRLGILNIHRLRESILYEKLRAKHRLQANSLEQPIPLDSRNLDQRQWKELEKLGQDSRAKKIFEITDKRLVDNGFDVKCFHDSNGVMSADLYGICNIVPTYGVNDLGETLDLLSKNSSSDLADVRPTKVLFYLQGEAARMAQKSFNLNSRQEAKEMLDQLTDNLKAKKCFHLKPVFTDLFNLNELGGRNISFLE